MYMASTKKFGYAAAADIGIYTRNRREQYKYSLQHKQEEKKISQKALYAIILLVAILLFSSWFGMIFFKSIISGVQMEINGINKNIRDIQQENSMLQADKINALSIDRIKEAAEDMGMSLPKAYQIEYVDAESETANLKNTD